MSFLLDTCVISELQKPKINKEVLTWYESVSESDIFISALTIGELQYGIEVLAKSKKKNDLLVWFDQVIRLYKNSILEITVNISMRWGLERARLRKKGLQLSVIDGLIASTAIEHNFILVTRNVDDFVMDELKLLNPWE